MKTIDPIKSVLLLIDFQKRLLPAISEGETVLQNARRLMDAAALLDISVLVTEQNPEGLGETADTISQGVKCVLPKMEFDAVRNPVFVKNLPAQKSDIIVSGFEAHVCVLQTVLGLLEIDKRVFVVSDAIGSRTTQSRDVALRRMERQGAEIVTTEMVVFEWLGTASHPRFREVLALIK